MYEYVAASGINVSRPISAEPFREDVIPYQLFTWLEGEDLIDALPNMTSAEQFSTGIKTGMLMRKLHSLPPDQDNEVEPWKVRFERNVQRIIQSYSNKRGISQGVDLLVRYLKENQGWLDSRPQTFTHGDWNTENLILTPEGQIGIIDLSGDKDFGDPWWEFWLTPHDLNSSPHFYMGQIKGYFMGEPPQEFFRLLSYYMAYSTLEFLDDLVGEGEPESVKCVLNWFDDMRNPVPSWYYSQVTATHDDIPEIAGIYRSLIGTPGCTWDEDYPNKETAEHDISNGWLYALKKQDKIVAVVSIGNFDELGDLEWKSKNPCELARIGVRPELQKNGIGTLLLLHCFEIAKNQGFDGIRILVAKTNTSALALYEKNGFEQCGEVNRFDIDFYCYQIAFVE
jgi:serine/threonine-protein kinase